MKEQIVRKIIELAGSLQSNRWRSGNDLVPYFDEPLVGFASVNDQLFLQYKQDIGEFYLTPQEFFGEEFGSGTLSAGTVISVILPVGEALLQSNRGQSGFPSREWAQLSAYGGQYSAELRDLIIAYINQLGHRAIAPVLSPKWKTLHVPSNAHTTNWSERHAAYAAGLGTFSLAGALISRRGIAHRTFSVITDWELEPDERPYTGPYDYCLHYNSGSCGACVSRCSGGAITAYGYDNELCYRHNRSPQYVALRAEYGVEKTGCSLCQTKVPCEKFIPVQER
jgi:epoxyqueuosine reductase QueG